MWLEAVALRPGGLRLLTTYPWVTRRPIAVDEYYRMAEVGILGERDRVELIEGDLVATSPIGSYHHGTVNLLTHALVLAVGERAIVSVQGPVRLDVFSEPEPDFALLKPRPDFYRDAHAQPADVLLLIEVADTSLDYDRTVKRLLYARHAIPEFWVVDLTTGEVEICRDPKADGYASVERVGRDGDWSRRCCRMFAFTLLPCSVEGCPTRGKSPGSSGSLSERTIRWLRRLQPDGGVVVP